MRRQQLHSIPRPSARRDEELEHGIRPAGFRAGEQKDVLVADDGVDGAGEGVFGSHVNIDTLRRKPDDQVKRQTKTEMHGCNKVLTLRLAKSSGSDKEKTPIAKRHEKRTDAQRPEIV